MRIGPGGLVLAAALLAAPSMARAQGVSFSKDIVPIFKANCIKCHSARDRQGGLSLASYADLAKGGKGGKELAPKVEESRLVKYLEGTLKPQMPIGRPLPKATIDKIKAWVAAGAKADVDPNLVVLPDTSIPVVKIPVVKLKIPMLPQIGALAWSKDGKVLAVGTYQAVKLFNPADGTLIKELKGPADVCHSLQFSPDGKWLAGAGGPPAQQGEIKIWDTTSWAETKTITGHNDYIYSIAWSGDNKTLASASYDQLDKLRDTTNGSELKTLKDHADAVYGVAFNKEGTLLASCSADRSVKVWDVATGKRIYTLAGHTDVVMSVAWSPSNNQIISASADKTFRIWNVNAQNGNAAANVGGHGKTVNEAVYAPTANMIASVSDDKSIRLWNMGGGAVKTIDNQTDSMLSVVFSPDGTQVAAGGFDGTVRIYDTKEGKLVRTIIDVPKAPEKPMPAAAPAKPAAAPAKAGAAAPTKPEPKK
jgi:WD40 repeat protein